MERTNVRILITGGSGFIGTNLVNHLSTSGITVLNVDKAEPKDNAFRQFFTQADIMDRSGLKQIFSDFLPTHVIHLAARTDLNGRSLQEYEENITGTTNVAETSLQTRSTCRAIFASSRLVNVIGYTPTGDTDYNPTTFYGESKAKGELLVRELYSSSESQSWAIFRPTSIWGPWFGVPYRNFFDTIAFGRYFHPDTGPIQKSFGYVGNTVQQLQALACGDGESITGETMYVADATPIEVYDFAVRIAYAFGSKPIRRVNLNALRVAAVAGDCIKLFGIKNPPLTSFRLQNMLTEMVYDTTRINSITPNQIPLDDGIRTTVAWLGL